MMKICIGNSRANAVLMEKIWRFRHQQFVERRGWQALRKSDRREIDQFDHDWAIHFSVLKNDAVIGYSRLLPTVQPHLLSSVYPQIMRGQKWPRSHDVFEWTRWAAASGDERIDGVRVSRVLMIGLMEFCRVAGITSLIGETHPKLINSLRANGWQTHILSEPSIFENELVVPLEVIPSSAPQTLKATS
ncbi:GNAT family N-acetyltransferase (plasmid) [Rhizobium leguminosarum]|uniref:acyl-homoserine-lactone synthase n=1 Tax=Rhizobium leguminosarum TaxID=384 RepID=UPI001A934590|nr:acyl-homoserine-lactone synthase [Rhizobium leguminosarum]MBY5558676.1 GNAT family N-acetyltransferase [Rhizobium leguminosarum]QSW27787.1 GNAT family N-acetyltransferase [Rhizobium leguminosarum]